MTHETDSLNTLQVMNAMVATDPAKQKKLVDMGVLPLMQQLLSHGTSTAHESAHSMPANQLASSAVQQYAVAAGGTGGLSTAQQALGQGLGWQAQAQTQQRQQQQAPDVYSDHDGTPQLCLRRQVSGEWGVQAWACCMFVSLECAKAFKAWPATLEVWYAEW